MNSRLLILAPAAGAIAALVAACGAPVTTPAQTIPAKPAAASHPAKAPRAARTGDPITLKGTTAGETMRVTVVRVFKHARPATSLDAAPAGQRLVAVQIRLTDTGTRPYRDSPSNGATVVDAKGESFQAAISSVTGCPSFPGTEVIPVGASGLGCVVFQVPAAAKIVGVQFTLDSGLGPVTGQWRV